MHATGTFHTTAIRNSARTSESWGSAVNGSQKKTSEIDLPRRNQGADLLVASQRAAMQLVDFHPEIGFQQFARRTRRVEGVLDQQLLVIARPFQRILLLVVVRDER